MKNIVNAILLQFLPVPPNISNYEILITLKVFIFLFLFFMTGLVFLTLLYHFFLYQNVLGFLLIARDYLSVIYCGFISRCMYYLTVKILQLSADTNQENFYSLTYIYIERLVW